MAQQDIRYYLNGMLLVIEGKEVVAVATDGHRLAYSQVQLAQTPSGSGQRQEIIVPRKTILECQHLLEDSDEPLEISLTSNQVKFTFGDIELISKLVEGKFPDFQRVIPKGHKNSLVVGRDVLQAALQRAAILTTDKFKGVRFSLSPNRITVQSTNAEQEDAQEVSALRIWVATSPLKYLCSGMIVLVNKFFVLQITFLSEMVVPI